MSDYNLLFEIAIFVLIFIVSTTVPIYLFLKSKITSIAPCGLMSFGLAIVLYNIYSALPLPSGKTGELYEVFWLMPPIFVCIIAFLIRMIRKKK